MRMKRQAIIGLVCLVLLGCSTAKNERSSDSGTPSVQTGTSVTMDSVSNNFPELIHSDSDLNHLLDEIKRSDGMEWHMNYVGQNRLFFSNTRMMLVYDIPGKKFIGAVNLGKIDGGWIQGQYITCFDVSPDANALVVCNGSFSPGEEVKSTMYYINLASGQFKTITQADRAALAVAWSDDSRYYAFARRDGQVTVYDTQTMEPTNLATVGKNPAKLFFTPDQNIVLDGDKKLRLSGDGWKETESLSVTGRIMAVNDQKIVYFNDRGIYTHANGKDQLIRNLNGSSDAPYMLLMSSKAGAALSNNKDNILSYRLADDSIFTYSKTVYTMDLSGSQFSPDLERLYVNDSLQPVVLDQKGNKLTMSYKEGAFYFWLNDHTLVWVDSQSSRKFTLNGYDVVQQKTFQYYDLRTK